MTLLRKNGAWNLHTHNVPLNIPADLRLALRSLLESRGHVFAGVCAEIEQSRYQGQWCAIVESISGTGAQFTMLPIGRTISYSASFIRKDGVWQVNSHNLPFSPSAEIRLALKNFLESGGYEYAGLCEEIDQARNTGRWCATPVSLSGDSARFTVGHVLSGATYSVAVVRKGNAWTPAGDNVPFNVPSVLRGQLKTLIESRGYGYAGLCPEIDMSNFVGKWCAYPMLVSGDRAEFVVGAVYSSSSYKVAFVKRAGTWSVNSQNVPVNVPDGLRGAIRNLVESRGFRYAGLCLEIDQPNNVGKWCALVSGVPGDTAQVTIGPVLSDLLYTANLARHNGAWTPTTQKLPVNMPSDLMANIKSLIESRGFTYAGLCETVDQGPSLGKACAFIRWEGETRVVVTYGRVATDELHSAVFEYRAGAWMMISGDTTPVITPTPIPTNTPTPRPGNTPTPRPADPTPTPEPEHETPTPTPDDGEPETPTPTPDNGETPEPGTVVPPSLREAIAAYLSGIGVDYLGLCEELRVSEGATGSCAIVHFVDDAGARIIYGPVFGGHFRTVTFFEYSGEWLPVGGPEPVDDDEDSVFSLASFLLIGLAGVGATGLGAGLYAARNR